MVVEVFMPKMTDNMSVGTALNWLVSNGEHVERGQPILEVETDKATMELEAPDSGIIKGIRAGITPGTEVPVGEIIAFIVNSAEDVVPTLPPFEGPTDVVRDQATRVPVAADQSPVAESLPGDGGLPQASPAVRRIARELGVNLTLVKGTGPSGRIKEADVRAIVDAGGSSSTTGVPIPAADGPPTAMATPVARRLAADMGIDIAKVRSAHADGRITKEDILSYAARASPTESQLAIGSEAEWLELNRTQLLTGRRMAESVRTAPQFAITVSVDMTQALKMREAMSARIEAETDAHLSITGILVKAAADALKDYPRANASFVEGRIRLHRQINIGVAVGTAEGLVVPVIHDANTKSLAQISLELKTFQEKAKRMRFGVNDLTGGTFTISNLGMLGIEQFQAIINPPESAILAIGQILRTPVGTPDDTIALRPIMKMTLSVDHRSLDGALAAAFISLVKEALQQADLKS